MKSHNYTTQLEWTGNNGQGTLHYNAYERNHTINVANKPEILGSSDIAFRGDGGRHNPEELFLASIASCHMLWYLHLCTRNNVVVISYSDNNTAKLEEEESGKGKITIIQLNPLVKVKDASMIEKAIELHKEAHANCFLANSLNCPIEVHPRVES